MELMNLNLGDCMKFTGSERFPVQRGDRTAQTRLADMTAVEILALANGLQRDNDPRAGALFAFQYRRRLAANPDPGPRAA